MENESNKLIVYTDGGSRGNPGLAACAFVVEEKGRIVYKKGFFLGRTTNNIAEYRGVLEAYRWLLENRRDVSVIFKMDSELVSKQLRGIYKVKNKTLFFLWNQIKKIERVFGKNVSYVYIPRSENKEADRLLNLVLNKVSRCASERTT